MFRSTARVVIGWTKFKTTMRTFYANSTEGLRKSRLKSPPTAESRFIARMEEWIQIWQRRFLLFKGEMCRPRKTMVFLPWNPKETYLTQWTLSNLCGHGAFVFLALGYLESDFLNLRLYAFSGITLSLIFQYYREKPLWIPIRWNGLFLAINTVMIAGLLKEKSDAMNITEDQRKVYLALFERRGMKQEDFFHMINTAEKVEMKEGDKIIVQGQRNKHVYLVVSGSLCVMKTGHFLSRLKEFSFAGEMSFLRWQGKTSTDSIMGEISSADVICNEDCVLYRWPFDELDHLMRKHPAIGMMFESSLSNDMNRKLNTDNHTKSMRDYDQLLSGAMMDGQLQKEEKDALLEYRLKNNIGEEEHWQLVKGLGWTREEYEAGVKGGPAMIVLESYYQLVHEFLKEDVITLEGKEQLREFRKTNNISAEKHLEIIQEMGWSFDDYEEGKNNTGRFLAPVLTPEEQEINKEEQQREQEQLKKESLFVINGEAIEKDLT